MAFLARTKSIHHKYQMVLSSISSHQIVFFVILNWRCVGSVTQKGKLIV